MQNFLKMLGGQTYSNSFSNWKPTKTDFLGTRWETFWEQSFFRAWLDVLARLGVFYGNVCIIYDTVLFDTTKRLIKGSSLTL